MSGGNERERELVLEGRREVVVGVNRRPEPKTKGSEGVCDRGGEVIFCSVVSFQKGLAGQSCWVTSRVGDNR